MGRKMKRPTCKYSCKVFFRILLFIGSMVCLLYICKVGLDAKTCDLRALDANHIKNAHAFARRVEEAQCRPAFAKLEMDRLFQNRYNIALESFVKKDRNLNELLYQYDPPFGFRHYLKELDDILDMITNNDLPMRPGSKDCKRCIVIGSGGILHGLQLGHAINKYDVVIRLNNAPVHGYERDVGNKTNIRMTYPEGAPVSEQEYFSNSLFVTVLFKYVDFLWLQAILKNETLSIWDRLFFWKSVNDKLPLKANQIRILNPLIVKETAMDILQFPPPRQKWLGWNKNVPTIGAIAMVLATHLCDEVSIAGFGYDLSQPDITLHYYDNLCMEAMNRQPMHDISKERKLLQTLVREGVVKDLSGGLHCEFCSSHQTQGVATDT
ncbi:lactosylceramide alpha-2,3-sialyltransferase isoform X1 [Bufo bufo]|uniref:lactosylceramide alpha-2,3-sialyltransferase isoform X1 n=1 Tax=Bufo bufo TaxID=8384 RepID=UPI001ABE86FD|nr:lactosylceramide alpha-2,3-sialyltransferase isoform X1 [Bufo bufo]XP_040275185.1 lactosylceramide alpha-2,3-sialyltransferase isoform X1 [Bufo bufo]XP_040275186.1 lactosylceramide alpha-2,3-sialyltransferase isoform X1 [Bufo bufo]XP_040275188.1 lactosylceramide alpha-2,3-sialyltransferase isoform X1 [Bufo bufo]